MCHLLILWERGHLIDWCKREAPEYVDAFEELPIAAEAGLLAANKLKTSRSTPNAVTGWPNERLLMICCLAIFG